MGGLAHRTSAAADASGSLAGPAGPHPAAFCLLCILLGLTRSLPIYPCTATCVAWTAAMMAATTTAQLAGWAATQVRAGGRCRVAEQTRLFRSPSGVQLLTYPIASSVPCGPGNPTTSCGEENLLMLAGDRYPRENILVGGQERRVCRRHERGQGRCCQWCCRLHHWWSPCCSLSIVPCASR